MSPVPQVSGLIAGNVSGREMGDGFPSYLPSSPVNFVDVSSSESLVTSFTG